MNIICASLRSKITIAHLASLMLVSINGPPMHLCNSSAALSEWLKKYVSALDNKTTEDLNPHENFLLNTQMIYRK